MKVRPFKPAHSIHALVPANHVSGVGFPARDSKIARFPDSFSRAVLQAVALLSLFVCFSIVPSLFLDSTANAQAGKLPFAAPKSIKELPTGAVISTSKGAIEIEFFRNIAPITVKNFEHLSKTGFYKNLLFHRYVPGFVIQGGDPQGNGRGGPGYLLPPEFSNAVQHLRGSLGMARLSNQVNPERLSNGSQFYICLAPAPHLDGLYTVFARITKGLEVADALRAQDKILSVEMRYGS